MIAEQAGDRGGDKGPLNSDCGWNRAHTDAIPGEAAFVGGAVAQLGLTEGCEDWLTALGVWEGVSSVCMLEGDMPPESTQAQDVPPMSILA